MHCPHDNSTLKADQLNGESVKSCEDCGGQLLFLNSLNSEKHKRVFTTITKLIPRQSKIKCSGCNKPMIATKIPPITFDCCKECMLLWLDKGEYEQLFTPNDKPPKDFFWLEIYNWIATMTFLNRERLD